VRPGKPGRVSPSPGRGGASAAAPARVSQVRANGPGGLHMKADWPDEAGTSEIGARVGTFPGEQAGTDRQRRVRYFAVQANTKRCWLCGIRLPAEQMVADGGSACLDLRWYCRDMRACTERWAPRPARPAAIGEDAAETSGTPAEQETDADAARPVPV